jgi:hypothetical protein
MARQKRPAITYTAHCQEDRCTQPSASPGVGYCQAHLFAFSPRAAALLRAPAARRRHLYARVMLGSVNYHTPRSASERLAMHLRDAEAEHAWKWIDAEELEAARVLAADLLRQVRERRGCGR